MMAPSPFSQGHSALIETSMWPRLEYILIKFNRNQKYKLYYYKYEKILTYQAANDLTENV